MPYSGLMSLAVDPGVQGTRRKSSFLTASAFPSGAPVVPPKDLASRPRRNRRSATVREAFREVSEMSAWQQSPQDEHSERAVYTRPST